MKCTKCGSELNGSEKFCKACGQPVENTAQPINIQQQTPAPKKKKGHGCLIAVIIFLVLIGLAVAGIFILLPNLFSPKSLGIKSSREAYESAVTKLSFIKDEAPSSGSAEDYEYIYGEAKQVDIALSSEELTSFLNENRPDYYALRDVQVRINDDDTVELSAKLNAKYLIDTVLDGKYSEEEIQRSLPFLKLIPETVNIYTQVSGEISDNKSVGIDVKKVEIMGFALPAELYDTSEAETEINSLVDSFLSETSEKTGGSIDSIRVEDGELKFSGKVPSSLERREVG